MVRLSMIRHDDGTHSLARIRVLGSGQTDKFGSSKREGSGHEHRADTLEAICEGTRVIPKSCSPVLAVETVTGSASEHKD